jgi:ABC-2 type transport system ATP-binding protein
MLEIRNFKKYYQSFLALDVPEIDFNPGIHWVKGSNGSGKTTLFRSISGILPYEGEILLDQIDQAKDPIKYRMMVNYGEAEPLYPGFLTANDLITFTAKAKKASKQQIDLLVETFEIGSFMNNPTGSYSSGMLKKTSLILAFLGNPKLIILDEPLVTIDVKAVQTTCKLVQDFHFNQGVNFLISSHQNFEFTELTTHNTYQVANQTISITTI